MTLAIYFCNNNKLTCHRVTERRTINNKKVNLFNEPPSQLIANHSLWPSQQQLSRTVQSMETIHQIISHAFNEPGIDRTANCCHFDGHINQ